MSVVETAWSRREGAIVVADSAGFFLSRTFTHPPLDESTVLAIIDLSREKSDKKKWHPGTNLQRKAAAGTLTKAARPGKHGATRTRLLSTRQTSIGMRNESRLTKPNYKVGAIQTLRAISGERTWAEVALNVRRKETKGCASKEKPRTKLSTPNAFVPMPPLKGDEPIIRPPPGLPPTCCLANKRATAKPRRLLPPGKNSSPLSATT